MPNFFHHVYFLCNFEINTKSLEGGNLTVYTLPFFFVASLSDNDKINFEITSHLHQYIYFSNNLF
jgi:hypothetical protein